MKHTVLISLLLLALWARVEAKSPYHEMEGQVQSVVITDRKIVIVLSGTIRLAMFSADGNRFETPLTILDDVPITYVRRPESVDAEATWRENVEALRDATGKKLKLVCPRPSYTFETDRITSLSTPVLWITKP